MKQIYRAFNSAIVVFLLSSMLLAQQVGESARAKEQLIENLFRMQKTVKLTEEQQAKLRELRKEKGSEFAERLLAIKSRIDRVPTQEQLDQQRKLVDEARKAGKNNREIFATSIAALKLTDEQKESMAELRKEQRAVQVTIRQEILAAVGVTRKPDRVARTPPTYADVKYGPHERNILDFWQAKSEQPTPVLVAIHGGGFRGGNKSVNLGLLQSCLESGISVAAITYRFSQHEIAPASFADSARAIQFIRSKSKEWNIDPKRFAATGGSAGAGISLWLGFHDDMADANSDDPVLQQSTRLSCMFVSNGQTSYDPRFIRDLFAGTDTYKHSALAQLFGVDLTKLDDLPQEKYKLFEEVSAIPHLTKDDPPVILVYSRPIDAPISNESVGIHHARFGKALKDKMDKLGIPCEVHAGGKRLDGAQPTSTLDFMKKHFGLESN